MTATIDEQDLEPGESSGIAHRGLILAAIAVVLVAAVATWLLAFSSVFGVATVVVRGERALTSEQVRAAARVPAGAPLLRLDTAAIAKRVEALPDVASAQVATGLPSTVTITVVERVAVGVVQSGSGYQLVDSTGDQFQAAAQRPARLPLFVLGDTDARAAGSAVATVAAALPAEVRGRIDSIQALDPQSITLVLRNGRVVRWGGADRSAQKARVLTALLKLPGSQFDITDPDQPFVR